MCKMVVSLIIVIVVVAIATLACLVYMFVDICYNKVWNDSANFHNHDRN